MTLKFGTHPILLGFLLNILTTLIDYKGMSHKIIDQAANNVESDKRAP